MDLQISVFLLFIFFTAGHSLNCYECTDIESCEGEKITCPEHQSCFSSTFVSPYDTSTRVKVKGCLPFACSSGYTNISIPNMSIFCCDTDLCNAQDAPDPSVDSSFSTPDSPSVSNDDFNGRKCYYCDTQSCSKIRDCSGTEDHCFTATGHIGSQPVPVKGCMSKYVCDAAALYPTGQDINCCKGDLCNSVNPSVIQIIKQNTTQNPDSAQSVTQSFLFLCCSLLSFILLH